MKSLVKSAKEALMNQNYKDSLRLCNDGLSLEPENYHLLVFKAANLENLNNLVEALQVYSKAVQTSPLNPLALQGLMNLHSKLGKWNEFVDCGKQLMKIYLSMDEESKVFELLDKTKSKLQEKDEIYVELLIWIGENLKLSKSFWKEAAILTEKVEMKEKQAFLESQKWRAEKGDASFILKKSKLELIYDFILKEEEEGGDKQFFSGLLAFHLYDKFQVSDKKEKKRIMTKLKELCKRIVISKELTKIEGKGNSEEIAWRILLEIEDVQDINYDIELLESCKRSSTQPDFTQLIDAILYIQQTNQSNDFLPPKQTNGFLEISFAAFYHYQKGEFETALEFYDKLELKLIEYEESGISKESSKFCVAARRGICLQVLGDFENALNLTLPLIPKGTKEMIWYRELLFSISQVYSSLSKHEDSIFYTQKVLTEFGTTDSLALCKLAFEYFRLGKLELALEYCEKCFEIYENDSELEICRYIKGRILFSQQNFDESIKCFFKALKISSSFLYIGLYYENLGDLERAIKCFAKVVEMNNSVKDNSKLTCRIVNSLAEVENGIISLARSLVKQDRISDGINLLEGFVKTHKSFVALKMLGFLHLQIDQLNKSVDFFQKALKINADDFGMWEGLGDAYQKEGRLIAAMKAYERSVLIAEKQDLFKVGSRVGIAEVLMKLGKYSESVMAFEEIMDEIKESNSNMTCVIYERIGLANYLASKEAKEECLDGTALEYLFKALSSCLFAIKLDASLAAVWKVLGNVLCAFHEHTLTGCNIKPEIFGEIMSYKTETKNDLLIAVEQEIFDKIEIADLRLVAACHCFAICVNLGSFFNFIDLAISLSSISAPSSLVDDCCKSALRFNPSDGVLWRITGALTQDAIFAQHCFITAIEINSRDYLAWNGLAILYLKSGDLELASKAILQSQLLNSERWSTLALSKVIHSKMLTDKSSFDQVEHLFEICKGRFPRSCKDLARLVARKLLDKSSIQSFDLEEEMKVKGRFAALRLFDFEGYLLRGILFELSGMKESALSCYETASNLNPNADTSDHVNRLQWSLNVPNSTQQLIQLISNSTKLTESEKLLSKLQLLFEAKDYPAIEDIFTTFPLSSFSTPILKFFGAFYLDTKSANSLSIINELLKRGKRVQFLISAVLMKSNQVPVAIRALSKAIYETPQKYCKWKRLSMLLCCQPLFPKGESVVRSLVSLEDNCGMDFVCLASEKLKSGKPDVRLVEKGILMNPWKIEIWISLINLYVCELTASNRKDHVFDINLKKLKVALDSVDLLLQSQNDKLLEELKGWHRLYVLAYLSLTNDLRKLNLLYKWILKNASEVIKSRAEIVYLISNRNEAEYLNLRSQVRMKDDYVWIKAMHMLNYYDNVNSNPQLDNLQDNSSQLNCSIFQIMHQIDSDQLDLAWKGINLFIKNGANLKCCWFMQAVIMLKRKDWKSAKKLAAKAVEKQDDLWFAGLCKEIIETCDLSKP